MIALERGADELGVGVGHGNIDVQPVGLHDVRQQARVVAGRDEAAFGADLAARQARDRRTNLRVRQIELGRAQLGARGRHGCFGAFESRERRVTIAHAREISLVERQHAVSLAARLPQTGLLDAERGLRTRNLGAERIGIDAEQHLAGFDVRAFIVAALEQNSGHARTHLDLTHAFELGGILEHELQRARIYFHDTDLDGRRRRHRGRLIPAGGDQDDRRQ